jgi:hypothetical protein
MINPTTLIFLALPITIFFAILGAFYIQQLIRCLKTKNDPDRLIWIVILVFLQIPGAIIYWFFHRSSKPDP